jgi:hypothetical protein
MRVLCTVASGVLRDLGKKWRGVRKREVRRVRKPKPLAFLLLSLGNRV